jgi:hypothetical protein
MLELGLAMIEKIVFSHSRHLKKTWFSEISPDLLPVLDFILMRDAREAKITGKVGRQEISKLQTVENGQFVLLEEEDRVELELIYKLVTDIHNRDLEVKLENALETVLQHHGDHWLWQRLLMTS